MLQKSYRMSKYDIEIVELFMYYRIFYGHLFSPSNAHNMQCNLLPCFYNFYIGDDNYVVNKVKDIVAIPGEIGLTVKVGLILVLGRKKSSICTILIYVITLVVVIATSYMLSKNLMD
jgi:hypothetical protein